MKINENYVIKKCRYYNNFRQTLEDDFPPLQDVEVIDKDACWFSDTNKLSIEGVETCLEDIDKIIIVKKENKK